MIIAGSNDNSFTNNMIMTITITVFNIINRYFKIKRVSYTL